MERLARLRDGVLSYATGDLQLLNGLDRVEGSMGKLYAFQGKLPQLAASAYLFDSAEVTGDVIVGEDSIVGAGVRIIGDSHGPVRIGARVQILENSVLHLLPDNELILEDDVIIGPGAMIHGCRLGAGSVVEPGAIVSDGSRLGRNCLVRAGSLVPQRDTYGDDAIIQGFPGKQIGMQARKQDRPAWALDPADLSSLVKLR
jgi:carbonic anhydrase/acetyltransferase-like protein (isoleucine patch superfamily)